MLPAIRRFLYLPANINQCLVQFGCWQAIQRPRRIMRGLVLDGLRFLVKRRGHRHPEIGSRKKEGRH
jgi:hypothetical protein